MKLLFLQVILPLSLFSTIALNAQEVSHERWSQLLSQYVDEDGLVDYEKWKSNDLSSLDVYLNLLSDTRVDLLSNREQTAFWINAYNAFTIKLILDHYPVKSIRDIHNGNPWDVEWIKVGGKVYSLNQIEKIELIARTSDPRIHFAINCAALGCPPLSRKAYEAGNLDDMLENSTKLFIENEKYNVITTKKLVLSRIFDWYESDFGNVPTFIDKYSDMKIAVTTISGYQEYDWSLNQQ